MITRVSIFRKELDNLCKTTDIGSMYRLLFTLKTDENLDKLLKYTHSRFNEDTEKQWWFSELHKSIRQCDFFDRCYQLVDTRTPEQVEETNLLDKELERIRKTIVYELPRSIDGNDIPEDDIKKHEESYKTLNNDIEYKKVLTSKRKLLSLRDTPESVSGIFDALLWNLICVDKNSEIVKLLETVFALYDIEVRHSKVTQAD